MGFKELLQWTKQRKYDTETGGNSQGIQCLQLGFKGGTIIGTGKARVKKMIFESKQQGTELISDIEITMNDERSSSRKKTVSPILKSSMEKELDHR